MSVTLIVEDDPTTLRLLARLVERAGHLAVCASNLAESIEKLGGAAVDQILLDLGLPDGNGTDLLRRVRQLELPIRVAVITGVRDDLPRTIEALEPDFVSQKPVDVLKLIEWLGEPASDARGEVAGKST